MFFVKECYQRDITITLKTNFSLFLQKRKANGIRKSELKKFSTNEIRQELLNEIDLVKAELEYHHA
jgi:hypothetical protein